MGEVWRARDTRLDRTVAVKILPAELAKDAQLKLRLEREAKLISQLHHPNICSLFDVGDDFLVMELVDGESLADRLARGPLPIDEVLRYGAQIAGALDRAHRAGIVHRDLKPGNVMLTKSGAKLLDFGLAKSAAVASRSEHATDIRPLTQEGTIVGTFQYMAPEQLEGDEADARTDLFALGAVLYEMATGRRAFEGKSRTSLIAAIVAGEPTPVSVLQPLAPPALEHVIAKCLSKDPDDRWQSAHDVAEELRWIGSAGSRAGVPAAATAAKKTRERVAWIALLLAALAVIAALLLRPRPPEPALEVALAADGNAGLGYGSGPPAFSPDGKLLAYAADDANGQRMLWVRSIERADTRVIPKTADAYSPFWSPDGRFIAFTTRGGDLKKVAVSGGDPETLVARTDGGWSWNSNDVILFASVFSDGSIRSVGARGGEPAIVLKPSDVECNALWWPKFLPDGNHFLVLALGGAVAKREEEGLWLATLDRSEKPRFLTRAASNGMYVEPGYLLYAMKGVLRAQPFDGKKLRVAGEAATIAPVQGYSYNALFTASDSGLLLYQPAGETPRSELVLRNRKGEVLRKVRAPAFYFSPRVSPDRRFVAADVSDENAKGDVWIMDMTGASTATRFTFDAVNETNPVWSPAGDELVYSMVVPPTGYGVMRKTFGGNPQPVVEQRHGGMLATDWSPDGRYLAMVEVNVLRDLDVVVWSLAEKKAIPFAATPALESGGMFSPDGKWIAYHSDESGRLEIYAQPFPPTGAKYQVSTNGGSLPRWSKSGELFWQDAERRLNVAPVTTSPSFRVGPVTTLFPVRHNEGFVAQYDVLSDGSILSNEQIEVPARPMTLLINWRRRLEK